MSGNSIPSDEEFARASAALKKRSRGLSEVRDRILARFKPGGVLHEFFILDSSKHSFRAYVFYRWDRQIGEAGASGLASEIAEAVYDELGAAGRGPRQSIDVDFEFDSHENVEANYEGDYFNRLH